MNYIRPLPVNSLLGYLSDNNGHAIFEGSAQFLDGLTRIALPSILVYATHFLNISSREGMILTTAMASARVLTNTDDHPITNLARGTLLSVSLFWWKQNNLFLAVTGPLLSSLSLILTSKVYGSNLHSNFWTTPYDNVHRLYMISLPVLWNIVRSSLSPLHQSIIFTILPLPLTLELLVKPGVAHDWVFRDMKVINLGITIAGIFFSAIHASQRTTSPSTKAVFACTALINMAHMRLIYFGKGKRPYY